MTRDDIIRMAREAGFADGIAEIMGLEGFYNFAALVAATEREACAKVCEEELVYFTAIPCPDGISGCLVAHHGPVKRKKTATECAAAIRARVT
jgi:hypothetical protein